LFNSFIARLKPYRFSDLVADFFNSADFRDLGSETRSDYRKYSKRLLPVFGHYRVNQIKPASIRVYLDNRGLSSRVQANREKAFLSRSFRWGYERGLCKTNPCKGVKQFTEMPRERYVEDWEYWLVYRHAQCHVKVAMEISYLCAAREMDVLNLTYDQLRYEGIFIRQGKTGKKQIKMWSFRLCSAALAAHHNLKAPTNFVICQPNGKPYTRRGFYGGFAKARKIAREISGQKLDFTFHDLKAKGISDFEGSIKDKQIFSGHKTERQVAVYDRKIEIVPTLGVNRKKQ
jgi:hypothetical protein